MASNPRRLGYGEFEPELNVGKVRRASGFDEDRRDHWREYNIAAWIVATIFWPRRWKPTACITSVTISSSVRKHPSDSIQRIICASCERL